MKLKKVSTQCIYVYECRPGNVTCLVASGCRIPVCLSGRQDPGIVCRQDSRLEVSPGPPGIFKMCQVTVQVCSGDRCTGLCVCWCVCNSACLLTVCYLK